MTGDVLLCNQCDIGTFLLYENCISFANETRGETAVSVDVVFLERVVDSVVLMLSLIA